MEDKLRKSKDEITAKRESPNSQTTLFPIVGLGASAGGLEALEQFLSNVPENSGLAYVVVQHLDPTQKGMLPELLQRITRMKVFQAKEGMRVLQNCVYVIPPNATMSISKGKLHLSQPLEARGLRLPIDFFFESLANDIKELSAGVILSGMGSDGSMGIGAIKDANGLTMVQDPATSKYESMPQSAIDTGLIDIIAPADSLPSKLISLLVNIPAVTSDLEKEVKDLSSLQKIISLVRFHNGNDFSLYKKNTLYRRIERRMGIYKIDNISSYVRFLHENPKEVEILFNELLIGVTFFFRDAKVWEKLKDTIIPGLLVNRQDGSPVRVWVPGCSTGEEAYSIAILFKEAVEKINSKERIPIQIFATDLSNEAIEIARKGIFSEAITPHVSLKRMNRFFVKTDDGIRINAEIREMVVFAKHNVIMNAPFSKVDLITCRNLLIYMERELQKNLLCLFYNSLKTDGILILGHAETLGAANHFFTTIDAKLKIFKRANTAQVPELLKYPYSGDNTFNAIKPVLLIPNQNIQALADQLLLQNYSSPGVLVSEKGDIIYTSGRTGKYLEPAVGKANLNIFAMLREGLSNEFIVGFRKALIKKESVVLQNLKVGTNCDAQFVRIKIQRLDKPEPLKGMVLIIFNEVPEAVNIKLPTLTEKHTLFNENQSELMKELQDTREEMLAASEEMQTSQEELKSTNEELQRRKCKALMKSSRH